METRHGSGYVVGLPATARTENAMTPSRISHAIRLAALLAGFAPSPSALAQPEIQGISFFHKDWEIACDNTGTCRAAGYQKEDEDDNPPVSVLLTRRAGPGQAVTGELQLGTYSDEEPAWQKQRAPLSLRMEINGKSLGDVAVDKKTATGKLSARQTRALLDSLGRKSDIRWSLGKSVWTLSDDGAAAVLLKMDDFQKRIGTTGALTRKGTRNEDQVLQAAAPPVIVAVTPPKTSPADQRAGDRKTPALLQALRSTTTADDCMDLFDEDKEISLTFNRLSRDKLVVSARCWMAAYNEGIGSWIINAQGAPAPVLVTINGNGFEDGAISEDQKGRGLGDCWAHETWTWNGADFIHTASTTSGMCKLVAPGGPWDLPTLVTVVKKPGR